MGQGVGLSVQYLMKHKDKILDLYINKEVNLTSIADMFNSSATTIRKLIVKVTGRTHIKELQFEKKAKLIEADHKKGMTVDEILDKYCMCKATLYSLVKRTGITVNFKTYAKKDSKVINKNYKKRICRKCGKEYFSPNILYCDVCYSDMNKNDTGCWWDGNAVHDGNFHEIIF